MKKMGITFLFIFILHYAFSQNKKETEAQQGKEGSSISAEDIMRSAREETKTQEILTTTTAAKPKKTDISQPSIEKSTTLSPIAESLFKNVKTKLTNEEKYQIAWLTGIKQEELDAKTKRGKPKFELNIYPVDFNNDGEEEIFLCITTKPLVIPMHTYCFYAKNDAGKYKLAPGKIGQGARILLDGKTGFPDLIIGTPGFDREIWSWNGQTYQHVQNISGKTPIPYATKNIDDASKEYVGQTANVNPNK